jgi:hypothetical protein
MSLSSSCDICEGSDYNSGKGGNRCEEFNSVMLTIARYNSMLIYSANDVMSKCYYTCVIGLSFLNGFIMPLTRIFGGLTF